MTDEENAQAAANLRRALDALEEDVGKLVEIRKSQDRFKAINTELRKIAADEEIRRSLDWSDVLHTLAVIAGPKKED